MAKGQIVEYVVEDAALKWLSDVGWCFAHGPDIAPDSSKSEQTNHVKQSCYCVYVIHAILDGLLEEIGSGRKSEFQIPIPILEPL